MRQTRLKLMIVDDHAETRALIRELIGHYVDEIVECVNGEEAATKCAEFTTENRKAAIHAGACHFFSKNNILALLSYVRQQTRILTASKVLFQ